MLPINRVACWSVCRLRWQASGRLIEVSQVAFEGSDIHALQGAANGCLARHAATHWLEGGDKQGCVLGGPLRNGGSAALLTEEGGGDDAEKDVPRQLLSSRFAGIRHQLQGGQQTAILRLVHREAPCNGWLRTRILHDEPRL